MIRAILLGRTGNNLFQYAAARALAERRGTEVWLDGSGFDDFGWRGVSCIDRLPLKARVTRQFPFVGRVTRKLVDKHPWEFLHGKVWRENPEQLGFDASVLDLPSDCVLKGYFQTWRYFTEIEESLREELDLSRIPWRKSITERADFLTSEETVAVHIRRTDYVNNQNVGFLDEGYYQRAIQRMKELIPNVRFHIFSDDHDACRKWLDSDFVHEEGDAADPLEDLFLMSSCRHQIIANSSYSWWAAWLGKKPGQRVLMPSEWSRGKMVSPIEEKRCEGWECIAV